LFGLTLSQSHVSSTSSIHDQLMVYFFFQSRVIVKDRREVHLPPSFPQRTRTSPYRVLVFNRRPPQRNLKHVTPQDSFVLIRQWTVTIRSHVLLSYALVSAPRPNGQRKMFDSEFQALHPYGDSQEGTSWIVNRQNGSFRS